MLSISCNYETVKYVNIRDSRLGLLRSILLFLIIVYVVFFELWAQGGWLESVPVVGVVRFSLQQPTVDDCDPNDKGCENAFVPLNELPYCQQAPNGSSEYYPGRVHPCQLYEATNAQIVSEKSIAVITRASTKKQELVCREADMVCTRTYNDTSEEHKFYTAQSEAFTILLDHAVTASKICARHYNYACSSEASKYKGRLYSKDANLCAQEYARGRAFKDFRGQTPERQAPCYITPNATVHDKDFFSLDVLLKAAGGFSLDDCNSEAPKTDDGKCQTYRDTGGTVLLNMYWSDFYPYHGMVEPFYYYAPQFLEGSSFLQNIPFYESYRSSRTLVKAHGIRVAVLLEGDYHQFNAVTFLITLTTALGLLAVATTIVDALMLYILPEKKRYQQAKYEEEEAALQEEATEQSRQENQVLDERTDDLNEPLL